MARTPKTPAFPFYGKDAYDDEAFDALTFAAQGFYLRLAWWQWSEGSIPSDLELILDKMPRKKIADARKLWPVLAEFFPPTDDGSRRQNATVEAHRARFCHIREKNSEGAQTTNAKRWGNRSPSDSESDSHSDTDTESLRARAHVANATAVETLSTLEEPEGVQGEPIQPLSRIVTALDAAGMVVGGGVLASWVTQYGSPDWIAAVIEDVATRLPGKRPAYLQAILRERNAEGWTPQARKPISLAETYREPARQAVTSDDVLSVELELRYGWVRTDCSEKKAREWCTYARALVRDGRLEDATPLLKWNGEVIRFPAEVTA